jgi:hypothetical protein
MPSISHQLHLIKNGRRCWTEICRKVDGADKKARAKAKAKANAKAREVEQNLLLYTYKATCHEIFIF